jgi:hypothetical protein
LVEIEVRDEILHPVLREEFFELAIELRAKGFVVDQNKGRAIEGSTMLASVKVLPVPVAPKMTWSCFPS